MKKRFLAIAIATSLSPLAAQADATVYGKLHATYGMVDTGAGGVDNWQLDSHASRLGFKGSDDLGNGLTATFKIEYQLDLMGSTAGELSGRNQYIGLKGDFGELRVGHHDTPLKMSQGKFDQFNDGFGDMTKNGMMIGDTRLDVVAYIKKFGDLTFAGAISPSEGNGTTAGDGPADNISVAFMYKAGPAYAAFAMTSYDDQGNTAGDIEDLMRLTGTYNMGKMEFGFIYEAEGTTGGTGENEAMGISFGMGMGKNKVKFQYMDGENGTTIERTQMSLGYDWGLSKRTTAYVLFTDAETETSGVTSAENTFTGVGMIVDF